MVNNGEKDIVKGMKILLIENCNGENIVEPCNVDERFDEVEIFAFLSRTYL